MNPLEGKLLYRNNCILWLPHPKFNPLSFRYLHPFQRNRILPKKKICLSQNFTVIYDYLKTGRLASVLENSIGQCNIIGSRNRLRIWTAQEIIIVLCGITH